MLEESGKHQDCPGLDGLVKRVQEDLKDYVWCKGEPVVIEGRKADRVLHYACIYK